VRPAKAGVFSGRQTRRGNSQNPVARMAAQSSGNQCAEAHRQHRPWGGGKSPGRNASERRCGLEMSDPGGRALNNYGYSGGHATLNGRRQQDPSKSNRSDGPLRRGETDSMVTRARQATGETLLVPARNGRSKVGRITGITGKAADGERVAEGRVVAMKLRHVRGAKAPCCG
jgi:hypothetical protein